MNVPKLVLSLVFALLVASPAFAQDHQEQAAGRQLFQEGLALFKAGNYELACTKLEASLRHFDGLGTKGKLAQCYEKIGRTASAWALFREVSSLAAKRGETERAKFAKAAADRLLPELAYLRVEVPANASVPGLVIEVDGAPLDAAMFGSAIPRDPKELTIRATAPGYEPWTTTSVAYPGQRTSVTVGPLKAAPTRTPPPAPFGAGQPQPAPGLPPPDSNSAPAWQLPVAITGMALGGVGLALGGIFGGVASATYDDAFESGACNEFTAKCTQDGIDDTEAARTFADVSTASFVAGGVLAAAGLIVLAIPLDEQETLAIELDGLRLGIRTSF